MVTHLIRVDENTFEIIKKESKKLHGLSYGKVIALKFQESKN